MPPPKYVVLGLGNILHSDDGVGPQAIERMRSDARVPEDVALIEGGTLGLELLPYIWDCSYLLVLDAVDIGQPPGTLVRMSSQELQTLPGKGSVHQLGVADLLVASASARAAAAHSRTAGRATGHNRVGNGVVPCGRSRNRILD